MHTPSVIEAGIILLRFFNCSCLTWPVILLYLFPNIMLVPVCFSGLCICLVHVIVTMERVCMLYRIAYNKYQSGLTRFSKVTAEY